MHGASRRRSGGGARAGAGEGAGKEQVQKQIGMKQVMAWLGHRMANLLPNTTGAAVRLCNAVKGYPDVPRYCTQLRAVGSI